jgi:hypothetical protein
VIYVSGKDLQPLKADFNHVPFLAQPAASNQPQRLVKGTWHRFKEKQRQRVLQAQAPSLPLKKCHIEPKRAGVLEAGGKGDRGGRYVIEKGRE